MNQAATSVQTIAINPNQQRVKTLAVITAVVVINLIMMQTAGAAVPIGQSISDLCKNVVKPILWGLAALVAIVGVGRGIIKMQNEENGGATIMMAFIGAILIGSLPAAAAALVDKNTIGFTAATFCN